MTGHRIINIFKTLYRILSSKTLLLWLTGGWIVFYVTSAIWMKEAFGFFVGSLRNNLLMQIPFAVFLLTGYLNFMRASINLFRTNRMQFLAWLILPVGALLFISGFFMSATMRESGQRFAGKGDIIDPPWSQEKYRIVNIDPGLKDRITDREAAKGIFAYEPKLTVLDRSKNSREIGAFPPAKFNDTYYHIVNFGIAPGLRIFKNNKIVDESYMILRIITPGSSDYFEIPSYPYRFLVTMEPETTVQRGSQRIYQFNLKDPVFSLRAFKGERVIAEGDARKGISVDDLTIQFFKPTFWTLIEAVKDPGVRIMHAGVIFLIIGLPLHLLVFVTRLFKQKKK